MATTAPPPKKRRSKKSSVAKSVEAPPATTYPATSMDSLMQVVEAERARETARQKSPSPSSSPINVVDCDVPEEQSLQPKAKDPTKPKPRKRKSKSKSAGETKACSAAATSSASAPEMTEAESSTPAPIISQVTAACTEMQPQTVIAAPPAMQHAQPTAMSVTMVTDGHNQQHQILTPAMQPAMPRFTIAAGTQFPIALAPHPQYFAPPHPFYSAATVAMPTPMAPMTAPPERTAQSMMQGMPNASILFQGKRKNSDRDGNSDMDRIIDIVTERDDDGDTCLHMSVVHANVPVTRQILETMVTTRTNVDPRNNLYQTPLHLAVITDETQIVKDLILAGADVNLQDRCGRSAAHLCCTYKCRESLRLLGTTQDESLALKFNITIHKLDTSIKDYEGYAPVHCSVIHNDGQALNILLEHGADIDEKDGTAGRTPLHHAVELQNLPITRYLVDAGANVNAVSYSGNSPLHTAAGRQHRELVSILMAGGADPTMVNGEGDTAKDVCRDKEIKRLMNR